MYVSKNELIRRLAELTGRDRREFQMETVSTLSELYESYAANEERTYLDVPYKDKDVVKLLGARYDGEKKKWYIPPGVDLKTFSIWMPQ